MSHACEYENDDFQDCNAADVPASIHELHREYGPLNSVDLSTTGINNVFTHNNFVTDNIQNQESDDESQTEEDGFAPDEADSIREVRMLPFEYFRSKLVEHFDIKFEQKKLIWPKLIRKEQSL